MTICIFVVVLRESFSPEKLEMKGIELRLVRPRGGERRWRLVASFSGSEQDGEYDRGHKLKILWQVLLWRQLRSQSPAPDPLGFSAAERGGAELGVNVLLPSPFSGEKIM